jgi:hypothetical protein
MCLETGLAPYNQTQKPERHSLCSPKSDVSWLSRGPDSSGEVWIGCKRLILKLSKVLSVQEVKGFLYATKSEADPHIKIIRYT